MMKSITNIFALLMFSAVNLFAQANEEMIKWTLSVDPNTVKENAKFDAKLNAQLGNGWHLYSISQVEGGPVATSIKIKEGQPFKFADRIKAAPPIKTFDSNFRMETEFYQDKAEFVLPILANAVANSSINLVVEVTFQLCNDESCLPPTKVEVSSIPTAQTVSSLDSPTVIKSSNLAVGDFVPDFAFTDFEGKNRNFSEFKGKIVLIDFWATWCSPCLKDIPKLKVFYDKYKVRGFEIIGLQSETIGDDEAPDAETANESLERAKQIVKTRGANWTQANDKTATPIAKKMFSVAVLPTKILIGKDGKIVARIGEKDDLERAILGLMESK